jgi:uncharacterized membrane protein YebE (DUF533 family)
MARRRRGGSALGAVAAFKRLTNTNSYRKARTIRPRVFGNGVASMLAIPALAYLAYKNRDNLRSLASSAKTLPWRVKGSGRRRRRSSRARGLLWRA